MASIVSMKALLESGVHFGHRTNKWDPRMKPFIFTERNGIHIIDLQQTVKALSYVYNLIAETVKEGGLVLFVGTKRQAQETIRDEAIRCGMPYVTERWLGGTLTNWVTISQRIAELERLEQLRDSGEINRLTKKEGLLIEREIRRLEIRLSGIRNMNGLPKMLFVVDVNREATAVHEANLKNIPIVAMVDTNCNPTNIDYVIPSNDDAIRAVKLVVSKIADAVLEGKALRKEEGLEEELALESAGMVRPMRIPPDLLEEDEFEEEDLLGEATLAKLASKREKDEEEEEEEEEEEKDKKEKSGKRTKTPENDYDAIDFKDEDQLLISDEEDVEAAVEEIETSEVEDKPLKEEDAPSEEEKEPPTAEATEQPDEDNKEKK